LAHARNRKPGKKTLIAILERSSRNLVEAKHRLGWFHLKKKEKALNCRIQRRNRHRVNITRTVQKIRWEYKSYKNKIL